MQKAHLILVLIAAFCFVAVGPVAAANLVTNGNFASGDTFWNLYQESPSTLAVTSEQAVFTGVSSPNTRYLELSHNAIDLSTSGGTLTFYASGPINVKVYLDSSLMGTYTPSGSTISVNIAGHTGTEVLKFQVIVLPSASGTDYIDDVVINTAAPTASFTGSPTSGVSPLDVTFTNADTNATSYYWLFGDGIYSTSANPTHTYSSPGTYSVAHQASNGYDIAWQNRTNYITVSSPVVASFSCTPISIGTGQTVSCTDSSSGSPTSWSWNFGDGNSTGTTVQNPTHLYLSSSVYSVALTASKSGSSNTYTRTNYITVGPTPVADFSANVTTGIIVPAYVQFTDSSTGSPTSWSWDFGDGFGSTAQSPIHQYTAGGTYTVAMTATNSYGSNTKTRSNYIVTGGLPGVSFTANRTTATIPNGSIQFNDTSTGSPSSWSWGFGDGTSNSTLQNPVHNYTAAGTYNVGLIATNGFGSSYYMNTSFITILAVPPVSTGYIISGTVSDSTTGAKLESVPFTLSNLSTTWTGTAYTNNAGAFYFVNLSSGTYVLSSSPSGYSPYTSANIVITSASPDPLPIVLTPSTTTPSSIRYYPHLTRFVVKDLFGTPIPGVVVTAQGYSSTASHTWINDIFGLDLGKVKMDNESMSGVTGVDGAVVFLMLEIIDYQITLTEPSTGVDTSVSIFPKEDSYLFQLVTNGALVPFSPGSSEIQRNLTAQSINYTAIQFNAYYNDTTQTTTSINFWVSNSSGVIYTTGFAASKMNVSYVLLNFIPGSQYQWGFNATVPAYGYITGMNVITAPAGRLLHPLEDRGIDTSWYMWITVICLIFFVGMFSGTTNVYSSILFPIWSLFFTLIGWLDWCPLPFVLGVAALGGMVFISRRNSQYGEG